MRFLLNCSLQIFCLLCSLLFSYIGVSNASIHSDSSFLYNGYQNGRSLAEINSMGKETNYEVSELDRSGGNLIRKLKMYRKSPDNTNLHMSLLSMNTKSYPTYGYSNPLTLALHQGSKLIDHSQKGKLLGSFLHTNERKELKEKIVPEGNTLRLIKDYEDRNRERSKRDASPKNITRRTVLQMKRKFESDDSDDED